MLTNIAIIVFGLATCIAIAVVHVTFTNKYTHELRAINNRLGSIQHSIGDNHVR